MSNYIDLVTCKHPNSDRTFIFYAPAWTHLKCGTDVIVETKKGNQPAKVMDSVTVEEHSDIYDFIIKLSKATLPLKRIMRVIEYRDIEYKEEETCH